MQADVVRAAKGEGAPDIPPQHLVFACSLMDYLQDDAFVEVSARLGS